MKKSGIYACEITKLTIDKREKLPDLLVVEEPLEIRILSNNQGITTDQALTLTMRTPGNDKELTVGFLITEGIITQFGELTNLYHCINVQPETKGNVIKVVSNIDLTNRLGSNQRNFNSSSSCGVCGKQMLSQIVRNTNTLHHITTSINIATIHALPPLMKVNQTLFKHTGGLHAAALFTNSGKLQCLREDIGRHNAVDKVIGANSINKTISFNDSILVISSRVGYEIIQKVAAVGIPILIAIGSPSSMAVEIAKKLGITLIGFAKDLKFNCYHGAFRIENNISYPKNPTSSKKQL